MQCTRGNNAYCFTLRKKKKKKNSIQVEAPTSKSHMCTVGQEVGKRNDFELKARQSSQPSLFTIFFLFPFDNVHPCNFLQYPASVNRIVVL